MHMCMCECMYVCRASCSCSDAIGGQKTTHGSQLSLRSLGIKPRSQTIWKAPFPVERSQ